MLPFTDEAGAAALSTGLEAAVAEPIAWGDIQLTVGVTVGVSIFPRDGRDAAALIHHADGSMYLTKRDRRGVRL